MHGREQLIPLCVTRCQRPFLYLQHSRNTPELHPHLYWGLLEKFFFPNSFLTSEGGYFHFWSPAEVVLFFSLSLLFGAVHSGLFVTKFSLLPWVQWLRPIPMETPFPFLIALTDTFINISAYLFFPLDLLKAGAVHYVELFMDLLSVTAC